MGWLAAHPQLNRLTTLFGGEYMQWEFQSQRLFKRRLGLREKTLFKRGKRACGKVGNCQRGRKEALEEGKFDEIVTVSSSGVTSKASQDSSRGLPAAGKF